MPNSIEKIIEKATIPFPEPQTLKRVEDLLHYIAINLPADINYNPSYHKSLIHKGSSKRVLNQRGSVKITANIRSLKNPGAFDGLNSSVSEKDYTQISTLTFQIVPGWDISDYRPEVLNLWDEVRELTKKYFSKKSKK